MFNATKTKQGQCQLDHKSQSCDVYGLHICFLESKNPRTFYLISALQRISWHHLCNSQCEAQDTRHNRPQDFMKLHLNPYWFEMSLEPVCCKKWEKSSWPVWDANEITFGNLATVNIWKTTFINRIRFQLKSEVGKNEFVHYFEKMHKCKYLLKFSRQYS